MNLNDKFWQGTAEFITNPDHERALIADAARGDEAATMRLAKAYLPALRRAVKKYETTLDSQPWVGKQVGRQVAFTALLVAIKEFNPDLLDATGEHYRLAGRLKTVLHREFDKALSEREAAYVPARTRAFYFSAMSRAKYDYDEALSIAMREGMEESVFRSIYEALNPTSVGAVVAAEDGYLDDDDWFTRGRNAASAEEAAWLGDMANVEDGVLVAQALAVLTDEERAIIRLAYGFDTDDHEPMPDGEIANRLAYNNRLAVLRRRDKALTKMREALGVNLTDVEN